MRKVSSGHCYTKWTCSTLYKAVNIVLQKFIRFHLGLIFVRHHYIYVYMMYQ